MGKATSASFTTSITLGWLFAAGAFSSASANVLNVTSPDVVGGVTIWRGVVAPGASTYQIDTGGSNPTGILDQQTGQNVSDLVGTATAPTFYIGYGTINTVQHIGFRVRLNGFSTLGALKQVTYIGFDFNTDGVADMFVGADNQPQQSGNWATVITDAGSGTNTSPNTTTIPYSGYSNTNFLNGALYRYLDNGANGSTGLISYMQVTNANATIGGDVQISGDADAFLTWAVPYSDFVSAVQHSTVMGSGFTFTPDTLYRITASTSNQANALNQDNMGPNGVAFNWSSPLNSSGIVPIPEPSTALSLGALLTPWLARRRRRS